jgi:hypothetical protein
MGIQDTGFTIGGRPRVDNGCVSNEFRPGHPVILWLFIVLLIFGFVSGTKAMVTLDDCADEKHWRVLPPEWVCSSGGIELTR